MIRASWLSAAAVAVVVLVCSAAATAAEGPPEAQARAILQAAGVQGGLVIHVGCGDGRLTAALRAGDAYLIHGLDTDADNVAKARETIAAQGLYGPVSVDVFDGKHLPYVDNLVNLVVADDLGSVAMEEVLRILAPEGVAYIGGKKTVKPRPETLDEWTHYLHGPDNNAVAEDSAVGPPRQLQWISEPRFARSHDHLASVTAAVSAGGRLFYIVDMGSIAFVAARPQWRLVARDAFSGVKLWDREVGPWEYHLRDFRSGPADIARRLVAVGDRVYVTLGYGKPVTAVDAATGETVRTYAGTQGTREILYDNGTLLLVLGEPRKDWQAEKAKRIVSQPHYVPPFERYTPPAHETRVMAVDAGSGRVMWTNTEPYAQDAMPSTLAACAGRVYFQNADAVICLDAATGQQRWTAPRPVQRQRLAWSAPTLVAHGGMVFSADRAAAEKEGGILWIPSGGYHEYIRGEGVKGELIAFNAETGERLWTCPAYEGFNAPVDVLISGGLLWTGRYAWGNDPGITEARDPKTGEVRRRRESDQQLLGRIGHARCHRAKATSEYLVLGRRGVEFVDLQSGRMVANFWVRGICQYGVLPANGLLYCPPHSCACSVGDLLKCGFTALAPERSSGAGEAPAPRPELVRGPAYGSAPAGPSGAASDAWPTYRHDAARSGTASSRVADRLQVDWAADLGGRLTSPVAAAGRLLVAETEAHRVHALDAATGWPVWTYTAGARIDSPPTIDGGRVLFGSADGCVYCVRLDDGALIWRFRAAPADCRLVAYGQLESPWPVSGSVLVVDGAAYFVAGRSSYLDGGMRLCKLDAATGRTIRIEELRADPKKRDSGVASGGYLPDVLASDGKSVFLRSARFSLDLARQKDNVAHLWSSVGFLDDSWWHRTYWQIGTSMRSGWSGWPKAGQKVPAGRLLVTDGSRVFGFGRNQYDTPGAHVGVDAEGVWGPIGGQQGRWTFYRLFGRALAGSQGKPAGRGAGKSAANGPAWTCSVPVLGRAMVLAHDTLFVAGPPVAADEVPHEPAAAEPLAEALEADRGGRLLAVSAESGRPAADYALKSPPVFDGMIAAGGRLYLALKDGSVVCMAPAP